MKNEKKNTGRKAEVENAADAKAVSKLNALYRAYDKSEARHVRAMRKALENAVNDGAVADTKKAADAARARFDEYKRTLPPMKFCTTTGEYFPAYAADGREAFRITVTQTITRTVEVFAANEKSAVAEARKRAREAAFWRGVKCETDAETSSSIA